jgi:hypothetical protein
MLSTLTPLIVFLLAIVASYAITRPIGYVRRYIGALLVSLLLGAAGGALEATVFGSASQFAIAIPIIAPVVGCCIGSAFAWRRRILPLMRSSPEPHRSRTKQASSRWHDHGARRA